MTRVVADISMSLDGFVTGPDPGPGHGLGTGGEPIHQWVDPATRSAQDDALLAAGVADTGAVVMGRRTFDAVDDPAGWDDDVAYGHDHAPTATPPNVVVTHREPDHPRLRKGFTFVTDGVGAAIETARELAGGRDVVVMGGADVIDQALGQGLVDEVRIHLSPVVMGRGTRLFDRLDGPIPLEQAEPTVTPNAVHLAYRVPRDVVSPPSREGRDAPG